MRLAPDALDGLLPVLDEMEGVSDPPAPAVDPYVRVEVVVPVQDAELRRTIRDEVFPVLLSDNCQAWDLQPDGRYVRRQPTPGEQRRNSQMLLLEALSG